jgi:aminopeptidase N
MTRLDARAASFIAVTVLAVFASLLVVADARAEPTFSFAATPGKLPKTVVPIHYALDLKPDLDKLTVAGTEVVDIEVLQPTDRLVLNAVNITVSEAAIEGLGQATIASDAKAETLTLSFARPLATGRHKLRIAYGGQINRFGRGLFFVDYPVGDGKKRMISSHLEPSEARRIFPSWDEPAFKASIELTVTVSDKFLAVSNTPVAQEAPAGEGLKRVTFQPTPKMSTYLFVLAAGELERITGDADGVTVGVVTTAGKSANGRFALDSAIDLLKYFNDYFGVKYPLAKLDLIAVPGGFGGAMENWGGITFFESRLLFDPNRSSRDAQRGIFGILAHEMAHQWFGDLVTNAWWNDIWLNEGFASWMASKSAEHLHPDWQTWLNAAGFKQAAMAEDARRTSHPIQQPVEDETAAMALFDVITYSKGQSVIRMIETYMGEDAFRAGIRQYMRAHAYSNTTTADLWHALEAASGQPIGSIAAGYTEQAGVPLVVAHADCVDGRQRLILLQERFSIRDPEAKPQRWQVPVALGPAGAAAPSETILLDGKTDVMAGRCGEPVKINLGDTGYYRVQYEGAIQTALARAARTLTPADRISLLSDTWALVEAARIAPAGFFELVDNLGADDNRAVWEQVIRAFSRIDHLNRGRPGREAFQAYARSKLRPVFDRLGWQARRGEPIGDAQLRARLIRTLGDFGDAEILAEAKRRFEAFRNDPGSLGRDVREPVTHLAGRIADRATYEALIALGRKTTVTDERVRYYSAAAGALDPAFAKETLAIALTDELPTSMIGTLISWVAAEHRELALEFAQVNYTAITAKQSPAFRNTFISNLMTNFSDRAKAEELQNFAPSQETPGGRTVAARARERILTDADFAERQLPAVDDWLSRIGSRP